MRLKVVVKPVIAAWLGTVSIASLVAIVELPGTVAARAMPKPPTVSPSQDSDGVSVLAPQPVVTDQVDMLSAADPLVSLSDIELDRANQGLPSQVGINTHVMIGTPWDPEQQGLPTAPDEPPMDFTNQHNPVDEVVNDAVEGIDPKGDGVLIQPVQGRASSKFGMRMHPILHRYKLHTGQDWAAPKGTPVGAAGPGVVTGATVNRAYGMIVTIDHGTLAGHRVVTRYAHLSAIGVKVGDKVVPGQGIGRVGSTGYSTGPHLHFEVIADGRFTNPLPWLSGGPVTIDTVGLNGVVLEPSASPSPSASTTPSASPSTTPYENLPSGSQEPQLTPSPADSPHESTTEVPSITPSASDEPSPEPTLSPSGSPSANPSTSPSQQPTTSPSPGHTGPEPSVSTGPLVPEPTA